MREIYYIGGSPCSGKSTIAEVLAAEYSFDYYKLDDYLDPHMKLAALEGKPHSLVALALDFEQMWMRDPQLQADEELAIYEEMLPYALRDISEMEGDVPIIAEGAGFTPDLMAGLDVKTTRYICIVPTEVFQREMYAQRTWIGQFLAGCKDPDAAFDNWMSRDALFARDVLHQAQKYGYQSIVVDGRQSIKENCIAVANSFMLVKK